MHLFEFMDETWLPRSLRVTLREVLAVCNNKPFRSYNKWIIEEVIRAHKEHPFECFVELGAGAAPLTRQLLNTEYFQRTAPTVKFMVTDLYPDLEIWQDLQEEKRVILETASVDYSKNHDWPEKSLLVLSATFHHLPSALRSQTLRQIHESTERFMIFESVRNSFLSYLYCFLGFLVVLLSPIFSVRKEGKVRRLFWCWVFPVAVICFPFDGLVSCFRCWTTKKWKKEISQLSGNIKGYVIKTKIASMLTMKTI